MNMIFFLQLFLLAPCFVEQVMWVMPGCNSLASVAQLQEDKLGVTLHPAAVTLHTANS